MDVMSKRMAWVIFLVAGMAVAIFSYFSLWTTETEIPIVHPRGEQFAGDQKCITCHTSIHNSFSQTGHNLSSALASMKTVLGSFHPDSNQISFPNAARFVMEQTDSGLYQIGFQNERKLASQRIDIAIGSGIRGQTYLHWEKDKLIQLPVSFNAQVYSWVPVPGSSFDRYMFRRTIGSGCLNCHSTHMEEKLAFNENPGFDKTKMILGITCERCHGPSRNHVDAMEAGDTQAGLQIRNPGKMNRKQQLDLCAQCHSGRGNQLLPFHFLPGDSLPGGMNIASGVSTTEVHGNQFDLLAISKCFLNSEMTCTTCHNLHRNERGLTSNFSAKCVSCHQTNTDKFCSLESISADVLAKDCITCHMPVRTSKVITFDNQQASKRSGEMARSHFISINPKEAKAIVDLLKEKSK